MFLWDACGSSVEKRGDTHHRERALLCPESSPRKARQIMHELNRWPHTTEVDEQTGGLYCPNSLETQPDECEDCGCCMSTKDTCEGQHFDVCGRVV